MVTVPWSALVLTSMALGGSSLSKNPPRDELVDIFDLGTVRRHIVCTSTCRMRSNNHLYRQICENEIMPRMTQKGCKQFSDTFRKFNGYSIRKHNFKVFYYQTFKQCRMKCLKAEVFCKSFEFHSHIEIAANCHLSSYGFMDVPPVYRVTNLKPWALLSRNCVKY